MGKNATTYKWPNTITIQGRLEPWATSLDRCSKILKHKTTGLVANDRGPKAGLVSGSRYTATLPLGQNCLDLPHSNPQENWWPPISTTKCTSRSTAAMGMVGLGYSNSHPAHHDCDRNGATNPANKGAGIPYQSYPPYKVSKKWELKITEPDTETLKRQ